MAKTLENKIHSKIKFTSSSRRVMFFLLYRQKDIDKMIDRKKKTTRVPDVVFMNFTSGIFSSKTLVSI